MKIWVNQLFRNLFFTLDSALFNFIPSVYWLLMSISRTTILNQATIKDFAGRIQMLLAIFMLFKVSFSLIMYVVNPDDFTDKSKGMGKLVQNTVISLVLLAVVPYIFNMAYRLQVMILEDNILGRIFLTDTKDDTTYLNTAGEEMAFSMIQPFYRIDTSIVPDCATLGSNMDENDIDCIIAFDEHFDQAAGNRDKYREEKEKDLKKLIEENKNNKIPFSKLLEGDKKEQWSSHALNYLAGIQSRNITLSFRNDSLNATTKLDASNEEMEENFIFYYSWPLSTIAAAVVILLLINFCLDIGVRSVKLAFLQLIAPIPIISYMDPKSGKDGLFSKWYKMCLSTFISLFVRLLALYFGIYIISRVGKLTDVVNGSEQDNVFVKIFIIIGVLMFIKQLPKILDNLGIKIDGDGKFSLNPFKKMENEMAGYGLAKRAVKGTAGAAMGLGMGAVGAATGAGKGKWLSGMFSGAAAGLKDKKMSEIHKGQVDANKRMREAMDNGSTFFGRRRAQLSNLVGSRGAESSIEKYNKENFDSKISGMQDRKKELENSIADARRQINDKKAFADSISEMEKRAKSEIQQGHSYVGRQYLEKVAAIDRLKNTGASDREVALAQAEADNYLNDVGMKEYMWGASYGNIDDKTFKSLEADSRQKGETVGITQEQFGVANSENDEDFGSKLHGLFGKMKGDIGEETRALYATEREIASIDDQVKNLEVQKQAYNEQNGKNKADVAKANSAAVSH